MLANAVAGILAGGLAVLAVKLLRGRRQPDGPPARP
jgi:hypothetical protein